MPGISLPCWYDIFNIDNDKWIDPATQPYYNQTHLN